MVFALWFITTIANFENSANPLGGFAWRHHDEKNIDR
jgi:hypothetical protein